MKSPFTGKEMPLRRKPKSIEFRKEEFEIYYHFYECEDTGEAFTDTQLDELNMLQIHNLYRTRHRLPFPEEIKEIREQYGLSAIKMSEILGLGANSYRQYEQGEVPNQSNGKLIQLAKDPWRFRELVELCETLSEKKKETIQQKAFDLGIQQNNQPPRPEQYWFGHLLPSSETGFKRPNLAKLGDMVAFFSQQLQPWKTQLNKLLFYADFLHYRTYGKSISGMPYRAITRGPVPEHFQGIFESFVYQGKIEAQEIEFAQGYIGEQFIPAAGKMVAEDAFSETEWSTLLHIAQTLGSKTAKELVEQSHQEPAWIQNEPQKQLISYQWAFELVGF